MAKLQICYIFGPPSGHHDAPTLVGALLLVGAVLLTHEVPFSGVTLRLATMMYPTLVGALHLATMMGPSLVGALLL